MKKRLAKDKAIHALPAAVAFLVCSLPQAPAGLHPASVSPGNVPWPGGVVPYVFDGSLSADQQGRYLSGLREYELAANVHFIPRTAQTQYVLFKYSPTGPNLVSGSNPQVVEINALTRSQICHEMGHSFGLEHEHQRANRDSFITVLYGNVVPGNNSVFDILPGSVQFGSYDFESVMHYGRDVLSTQPGVLDTLQPKPGFEKYQRRLGNFALSPVDRALMSSLYGPPPVPLSAVVTTTADGGVGSLRAAMYYATDHPGTTITFNIPPGDLDPVTGVFTIKPPDYLPPLVINGTIIDASTQPGYAGKPLVFLDGSDLVAEVPGLLFYGANCTVKGLGIIKFPWVGVAMLYPDATGNRIVGCHIGVDPTGNSAAPNARQGIQISDGAHGNTIGGTGANERNVISGNTQYGIWISGNGATGNTVIGNFLGLNHDGTAALPNHKGGIILTEGANHNIIGGETPASRNVISGNTDAGIWIIGSGVDQNTVRGNFLGLNAAGTTAVANTFVGLHVIDGASNNVVMANVISGNVAEGLRISGPGTTGNKVYGNLVGTSPGGDSAIPNGFGGVTVFGGATGNQVGGTSASLRNLLSGNGTVGLAFGGPGTQGNVAYGNYIGTNATGTAALPNGFAGVYMTDGSDSNHLGDGPGSGNLISGNTTVGVLVADAGTHDNVIRNNRIGTDSSGGSTLPDQDDGIRCTNGAQSTIIGGTTLGAANLISGNTGRGIAVFDAPTAGHTIRRNSIYGNGGPGIGLFNGSNHAQSSPLLGSAVLTTGTAVTGSLSSTPNASFIIEFFSSPGASPPGGLVLVGETLVTTNGSGSATFNVTLPTIVAAGRALTGTATAQATGDASMFSSAITVTSMDADSDGLPDAYESATAGLNPSNPADAALDNDHDGFTNLQEFVAGTSPNNPTNRPFTTAVISGDAFQLSFGTVAGKFYRIERSESLASAWETVAIHVAGTGGVIPVSVPLPLSSPRQFFRVSGE